jgi:hypothetical protein
MIALDREEAAVAWAAKRLNRLNQAMAAHHVPCEAPAYVSYIRRSQ